MKRKPNIDKIVTVLDDVDNIGGKKGVVVDESPDSCAYGKMYEVEFEDGETEWMMACDLEFES